MSTLVYTTVLENSEKYNVGTTSKGLEKESVAFKSWLTTGWLTAQARLSYQRLPRKASLGVRNAGQMIRAKLECLPAAKFYWNRYFFNAFSQAHETSRCDADRLIRGFKALNLGQKRHSVGEEGTTNWGTSSLAYHLLLKFVIVNLNHGCSKES